jgi:hypothetical protein
VLFLTFQDVLEQLPAHQDFVDSYCRAGEPV